MSEAAPLVVDLRTGLLRTDLAREAFWAGAARGSFTAVSGDGRGVLASASPEDLANMPMNTRVLESMRATRADGGRVVLVFDGASDVVAKFAAAVGCVDESIGEAPSGAARSAWLAERFGANGYQYAGDAIDAEGARKALIVGPQEFDAAAHLKALRPHQWVKNFLVFLPMVAAHRFDQQTIALSLVAFVAFSLVASSVYVLNDLLDLAADRAHPRKRKRPMASGAVPLRHATLMTAGCLLGGFAVALWAGPYFLAVLCAYTILTVAYSLSLKREPVIDVCVLAGLYTLRIVAGSAATGISLSVWLLAFSIFIFLSLAAVKRQTELVDNLQAGREGAAGRGYRVGDLPIVEMMGLAAGYVAVLVLALYLNAPNVVSLYERPEFLWVVCAVLLYWISRAAMIAHRGEMNDDPIVFALGDRVSQVCGVVVLAAMAAAAW